MRFFALLAAAAVATLASAEELPTLEAPEDEVFENEDTEDVVVIRKSYIRVNGWCYAKASNVPKKWGKKTTSLAGYTAPRCSARPYTSRVKTAYTSAVQPTFDKVATRSTYYKCTRAKRYVTRTTYSRPLKYNPYLKPVKRC